MKVVIEYEGSKEMKDKANKKKTTEIRYDGIWC